MDGSFQSATRAQLADVLGPGEERRRQAHDPLHERDDPAASSRTRACRLGINE